MPQTRERKAEYEKEYIRRPEGWGNCPALPVTALQPSNNGNYVVDSLNVAARTTLPAKGQKWTQFA